MKQRFNQW